jgi:hypothetical protein
VRIRVFAVVVDPKREGPYLYPPLFSLPKFQLSYSQGKEKKVESGTLQVKIDQFSFEILIPRDDFRSEIPRREKELIGDNRFL